MSGRACLCEGCTLAWGRVIDGDDGTLLLLRLCRHTGGVVARLLGWWSVGFVEHVGCEQGQGVQSKERVKRGAQVQRKSVSCKKDS